MRRTFLILTLVASIAACHHGGGGGVSGVEPSAAPAPPSVKAACYRLNYDGPATAGRFPPVIALDPGKSSGAAFWYPATRNDTSWRAFSDRGRWARAGRGHISVSFRDGDTRVSLDLEKQAAGAIAGRATRTDPGSKDGMTIAIRGLYVTCPPAPRT
ncbi:MAG: hypothetical protein ABI637_10295 [Gemmatimonadota bacterium]